MKKKIVTLIMAGSLSLGCLAGCGQTQQPAPTPEPIIIVQEAVEETVDEDAEEEVPFEVEEITPEQLEEAEPVSEEDKVEEVNLTFDEEEFKVQLQAEYENVLEGLLERDADLTGYEEELSKVKITDDFIRGLTEHGITDLESYWAMMISEFADMPGYVGPEDEKYNMMFIISIYFACSPEVAAYSEITESVEVVSEGTIADD